MSTTLSVQGTVYRSNVFDKYVLRKFGCSSGEANKEFAASIDLVSSPLPTFPYAISTQDVKKISFLFVQAIGGAATIRLVKDGYYTAPLDATFVAGESPSVAEDTVTFTTTHTPITGTLSVFVSGTRTTTGFTVSGPTIVFDSDPGSAVIVDYFWSPSMNPSPLATQTIDVKIGSTTEPTGEVLLMSGVDLSRLFVVSVEAGCILDVLGMGY